MDASSHRFKAGVVCRINDVLSWPKLPREAGRRLIFVAVENQDAET